MTGQEFRDAIGGKVTKRAGKLTCEIKDVKKFRRISRHLKVICDATPDDKHILVHGLAEVGLRVAVLGDENDSE